MSDEQTDRPLEGEGDGFEDDGYTVQVEDGISDEQVDEVRQLQRLLNNGFANVQPALLMATINDQPVIAVCAVGEDEQGVEGVQAMAIIVNDYLSDVLGPPRGYQHT
jgi:hypothetical protein